MDPNRTNTARGYDLNGKPCTGVNTVSGNDRCPFTHEYWWRAICPGGSTNMLSICHNPLIKIYSEVKFYPSTNNRSISKGPFYAGRHRMVLYRNSPDDKYDSFTATEEQNDGIEGGTAVLSPSWNDRVLNTKNDPKNLITLAGGYITFLYTGRYDCEFWSQVYGAGANTAWIELDPATGTFSPTILGTHEQAGTIQPGTSISYAYGLITVTAVNSRLRIRHLVTRLNTANTTGGECPTPALCTMGVPYTDAAATKEVYAKASCVKIR